MEEILKNKDEEEEQRKKGLLIYEVNWTNAK